MTENLNTLIDGLVSLSQESSNPSTDNDTEADAATTKSSGQQLPLPLPPSPPVAQNTRSVAAATARPSELTGSTVASPSMAPVNTTPRQGSKRYTHQSSIQQCDRKNLLNASISKSPATTTNIAVIRDDQHNDNNRAISLEIEYPKVLVPVTKFKPISQCSLLCCFYAEFDNTVGPKICYQYPEHFMELDIQSTSAQYEDFLHKALHQKNTANSAVPVIDANLAVASHISETPKSAVGTSTVRNKTNFEHESGKSSEIDNSSIEAAININNTTNSSNTESSSIFDSCSEYIITGNELTGNLINLSTHHIHLVTRPTILIDETYKRNTLLFSVGFVLRRTIDPIPYHPILSKLAVTLRDMEIESQYLSNRKDQVQSVLEGIVRSMNSYNTSGECNILLGPADVLHLKLFRSPRSHVYPVKDYSVPILVRRDWLHQGYEWDLSINWVSLHIDGIANAKQISKRAEVDFEMVRACLRVLKHHNVVKFIDMFSYSNRYECTEKVIGPDLLPEAFKYVVNYTEIRPPTSNDGTGSNTKNSQDFHHSLSPNDRNVRNDKHGLSFMLDSLGASLPNDVRIVKGDSVNSTSLPNQDGSVLSKIKREDYEEIVNGIVEFYIACHRDVPISEVWIRLITKQISSGTSSNINWNKMFCEIDHRRVITFGIIHGLIRRVHNYPLLLNRNNVDSINDGTINNAPTSSTPKLTNTIHRPRTTSSASTSLLQSTTPSISVSHQDRSRISSSHHSYHYHINKSSGNNNNSNNSNEAEVRRKRQKKLAASLMDGTHCDDEIICATELPMHEIIDMFPKNSIVSIYTTNNGNQ